ncbi:MAG: TonB-dependent receptor [Steroidobacteraceae bacterium]|jgi:iron complex outermembrane receptor protein|nr:TonB-dependent receptor [Steroidobacteraceae bacterium]
MASFSATQIGRLHASALALAACAGSAFAQAQQPAATQKTILQEIVVTAQRREQNLQEIPLSITAVSAEELETRGMQSTLDLGATAPNLFTRANPGAAGIATIGIRGAVTGQPAIWVDSPIGLYLDGVYLGKAQGGVMDVVDIERIEVLRGPQGTLFGRNTEGGAINFISRPPSGEFSGRAEISGGDYDHWIGRLNMDLPQWGVLSASIAARKETMDGWAENLTGPKDLGELDKEAYRVALRFDFTDDLSLAYSFDYSKSDNTPVVTSLLSVSGWAGTFPEVFGPALGSAIEAAVTPYIATSRPDKVSTPPDFPLWERTKSNSHTVVLDWQATETENIKYIFSDRSMDYNDQQSINGTPLTAITVLPGTPFEFPWGMSAVYNRITDYEQTSHELQWLGEHGPLKYVAGLYYFTDDGTTLDPQNFSMFGQAPLTVEYAADTEAKAVYAQADWDFADRWTLTAGIRYTKETREGFTHQWLTDGYKGAFLTDDPAACAAFATACLPRTSYSEDFTGTTPMAALSFRYSDRLNFFARVARGFKSGGFSSELIAPQVTTPYEPEFSMAYELGAKSTLWDGRAIVNATVFYTELTDQQTTVLIPGTTQSILQNAGEGVRAGFELETRVLVTDGWTFGLNYGFLDADFDKYLDNALNIPGRPIIDTAENRVPGYAPEHTVGVNLDGRLLGTSYGDLRLIVDYTYMDSYFLYAVNKKLDSPIAGGAYSAAADEIPATQQANVRLLFSDIPAGVGALDLSLLVRNVTDADKQTQGIDFSMFRTANWQEPRTWVLSAVYKW